METLRIDLPAMYGDHHVKAVRALVLALPGVTDIWASAALRRADIIFDPAQVSAERIKEVLTEAGYTQPMEETVEEGLIVFRHTDVRQGLEHTGTVSFVQPTPLIKREVWPLPDFIKVAGEE